MTRARIVLLAAAGLANAAIARRLGIAPNTVGKWRKRFYTEGLDGPADRKRSGRPRAFPAAVVAYAKAVACELPGTRGVPLSRWSLPELRAKLLASGLVTDISTTTLWRWLAEVEQRLLGFQRRYQQTAMPFDWRFTRADLDRLLRRLDEPAQPIKAV